ncbi:MAG: winged helix-turn-helix transcriptional regulator [Armatimonadetes bacterium]|nr:winged helix-turn-helix transcriptional regulator [Armatimonadota bacterium]
MRSLRRVQALGKALADETRLKILAALCRSDLCVCELSDALALPQPRISNHLGWLRREGFVKTRRDGTWIYYGISPEVRPTLEAVSERGLSLDGPEAKRLERRLAMRVGGKCLRSYGAISGRTT